MRIAKILVAIGVAVIVSGVGLQQANAYSFPSKTATINAVQKHVNTSMTKNSKGANVFAIQLALEYMGYLDGRPSVILDSKFGPNTKAAVKAFQKAKRLTQDGEVGPQTWKKLWDNCYNPDGNISCMTVYDRYVGHRW